MNNREIGNAWMAYILADLYEGWPARRDFSDAEIIEATGVSAGDHKENFQLFIGLVTWLRNYDYIDFGDNAMTHDGRVQQVELTSLGHAVLGHTPDQMDTSLGSKLKEVMAQAASETRQAAIGQFVGLAVGTAAKLISGS